MTNDQRLESAKKSLLGISIGDAFGECFFGDMDAMLDRISRREIPPTSWEFTDDTVMALAIFEELQIEFLERNPHQQMQGTINQDRLAQTFARNYRMDDRRGYGGTAHKILREIGQGGDWRTVSSAVFDGMGSMGNGAAMRAAPIGACFSDDLDRVAVMARASAEVTHFNTEGIAGAIAVAVAAALAVQTRAGNDIRTPTEFIEQVAMWTPESDTKYKIAKAATFPSHTHIETLKTVLGNGTNVMAQDTVPYCIWCAAHHLTHFEEALWKAVSILGDRDTICAIVGGIVILSSPPATVPPTWIDQVEDVFTSDFRSIL
jgi:ADP-ribosylglycohydrolase